MLYLSLTNEELEKKTEEVEAGVYDHNKNTEEAYILLSNVMPAIRRKERLKLLTEVLTSLSVAAVSFLAARHLGEVAGVTAVVVASLIGIRFRIYYFDKENERRQGQYFSYEWYVENEKKKRHSNAVRDLTPK